MRASRVWVRDDNEREGRTSERERHTPKRKTRRSGDWRSREKRARLDDFADGRGDVFCGNAESVD